MNIKKLLTATVICGTIMFNVISAGTIKASSIQMRCSNTDNYYSYLGNIIYSITARGYYEYERGGNPPYKSFDETDCLTYTFGWSASNKIARWRMADPEWGGTVLARATFSLGIDTQWINFDIQSIDIETTACAEAYGS